MTCTDHNNLAWLIFFPFWHWELLRTWFSWFIPFWHWEPLRTWFSWFCSCFDIMYCMYSNKFLFQYIKYIKKTQKTEGCVHTNILIRARSRFPIYSTNLVRQSMMDQKFWSAKGNARLQLGFLFKYFGPSDTDRPKFLFS